MENPTRKRGNQITMFCATVPMDLITVKTNRKLKPKIHIQEDGDKFISPWTPNAIDPDYAERMIKRSYPMLKFSREKDGGKTENFIVTVNGVVVHDRKANHLANLTDDNINAFLEKIKGVVEPS